MRYRHIMGDLVKEPYRSLAREYIEDAASILGLRTPPIAWVVRDAYGPVRGGDIHGQCTLGVDGAIASILLTTDIPADVLRETCFHEVRHAWQFQQEYLSTKRLWSNAAAEADAEQWSAVACVPTRINFGPHSLDLLDLPAISEDRIRAVMPSPDDDAAAVPA